MRAREFITEHVSPNDVSLLRGYIQSVWLPYKIDVVFDSHFLERLNAARNLSPKFPEGITLDHLKRMFFLLARDHGDSIHNLEQGKHGVLKNKTIGIVIPFQVEAKYKINDQVRTKIFLKTVIRTDQYHPSEREKANQYKIQHNKDFKTTLSESIKFILDPMYTTYYDDNDIKHNYTLININVKKLDKLWKKSWQYIDHNGIGQIKDRYQRFGDFLNTTKEPIQASTIGIDKYGDISFYNGRHRFAWFRDNNYDTIPVAMDKESIKNAKNLGLTK